MKTEINQQNAQINFGLIPSKHSTVITSRREHMYITTF